ncbi:homeodomain transcription factor [Lithospermum erythrorhizon]|uniref:Homeodomain transcription factor n=1 Tax=Lithospermum erythrorhizon TaxID=34254 RepID=A0AAV3PDM7_LITER
MREMERKERFLQKEYIRVEKMKIREELRKEKEAAKLKAANDRATARRMAKESVELIEDEHLELMELASSKKGLHSFSALDSDTLGDLKSFEDMLPDFPLKSVRLKRPFSTQPWDDSEENVGNLLMVWRFLINFADVLGLWPFTLEEFLQAFHEHDTRLMGEIHMALLRTIVKDIEDAARTLASAVGTNQSNVVNPAGGHPHIVEGAYSWGFDIKSWQKHINSLTWPEILRQLALSAGFGPKLKNKSVGQALLHGGNEGNDGANVISNLRNGVAAENALAMMQERGLSNPRRSRHRLTPGTVKYAAYYVLSLEGSNGLTIQDVAVKIQESGLRDLRTSKTPEASISAALSRDTKLFERTAPSTYCVRTPYRKDATDAEAVLTAAREKIQLYIGNSEGEEAEDVEKENTERDEDVESEVSEDHDVEDMCSRLSFAEEIIQEVDNSLGHGNINPLAELLKTTNLKSTGSSSISGHTEGKIETKSKVTSLDHYSDILEATNEGTPVVDENDLCEPWVQGLTEGEYYDLSVQERLNALVALIDVANEGHSMRSILEERMEAAYALKKQLWAEARLDKRRLKEDCTIRVQSSLYISNKGDQSLTSNMADSRQNPSVGVDVKSGLALRYNAVQSRDLSNQGTGTNVQLAENTLQEFTAITELHQSAYAFEKPKSQQKSFIAHKAEETYVYRSLPLGQDRRRNHYWQFMTSQSLDDPEPGRIFVELHDGRWRVIDSIEDFDSLLASIDVRGIRESHLHLMLEKVEGSFKEAVKRHSQRNSVLKVRDNNVDEMSPRASHLNTSANSHYQMCEDSVLGSSVSTSFIIDLEKNRREEWEVLKRYQEFEKWMWKECFNSGILCAMKYGKRRCKHLLSICEYCHNLYYFDVNICFPRLSNQNSLVSNLKFLEHVTECKNKLGKEPEWMLHILQSSPPSRIRLLKALLASVEASVPPEALDLIWLEDCRDFWITKLQDASSASEILQALTLFEGAVKRSFLSSDYESTNELFRSRDLTRSSFNYSSLKLVPVLPWIPETTSAVALRLMEFDKSIYYTLEQKDDLKKNSVSDNFMAVSSKYPLVHNITEDMLIEPPGQNLTAVRTSGQITSRSLYRGRGRPRCREGKFQRIDIAAKREGRQRRITKKGEDPRPLPIWKGKSRGRGENCGRKSAKKMQKKDKQVTENTSSKKGSRKIIIMTTLTSKHQDNNGQASVQAENGKDISSPEQSPSNCYVAPAAVDKYESPEMVEGSGGLDEIPSVSMKHVFDAVNEEDKEYEQVDDEKQDLHSEHYDLGQAYSGNRNLHSENYDDNQPLDEDAAEYYHAESDEGGKGSCDEDQVENSDGESTYSSSEYSE